MLGAGRGRVKAVCALALVVLGCFWRGYGPRAATHADLLAAMARKGTDLVVAGRLTAESMPELTYPLERAQAFVAAAAARSGATRPASLDALTALVAHYRLFLDALDRVRRTERGAAAHAALAPPLAAVEAGRLAVLEALRAEGR